MSEWQHLNTSLPSWNHSLQTDIDSNNFELSTETYKEIFMEQDLNEQQQSSFSYSDQQLQAEGWNASELITSQIEFALPSFGSTFPHKVTLYNLQPDPIYSIQGNLSDNHQSETSLPERIYENCSNYGVFPSTNFSRVSERSQDISYECSLNIFSNYIACATSNQKDDCFYGNPLQVGRFPDVFLPEISSLEENALHETDQTNSSEICGESVTRNMDSINSSLKGEMSCKEFSTIGKLGEPLLIHERENIFKCEKLNISSYECGEMRVIIVKMPEDISSVVPD
ncbi:hypothetical protein NPIL_438031 [Nephila pilipes]|uniref:Uncharacterized protein n=1 Tax=Nephila pilipes TaxID=299642 RepID=A0A8X6QZP1_NEPPI|nr:hypothetical protein NPIL_438031 [Nephila pilipes]